MTDSRPHEAKLLSLAVHELRTPVSVVSGYLRMLLRQPGDALSPQQRALVEQGDKSCGSLAGLLADLSELAQWEAGHVALTPARVDLAALLDGVAQDVSAERADSPAVSVRAADAPCVVTGDAARLASAFRTLLLAVLRERPESASVGVTLQPVAADRSSILRVTIGSDTGEVRGDEAGGAAEFDLYREGMGFRLLLAHRVLAAHGGRLSSPSFARGHLTIGVDLPSAPADGDAR